MFNAVVGGEFGQCFLAHIAALAEAHPVGEPYFEGVGVVVDLTWGRRHPLLDAPTLLLPGRQGRSIGYPGGQLGVFQQDQLAAQQPTAAIF